MGTTATTIAAILLHADETPCLSALADDILNSPVAGQASSKAVTWDCEDLVFLDFDALRIALQETTSDAAEGAAAFLCIAVGRVPGRRLAKRMDTAHLAQSLVKQLSQNLMANAVLWHEHTGDLSADTMDGFQDELIRMVDFLEIQLADAQTAQIATPPVAQTDAHGPGSARGASLADQSALTTLRDHLRRQNAPKAISTPIHASLYLMACTFFFLAPAVGTTLLSYVALRDGLDNSDTNT